MNKSKTIAFGFIVAALVISCAAPLSGSKEYGHITVDFAGSSARALATGWPGTTLPTFSSVTVTVSATDMTTITATASGYAGSLSIQVPAGNNRLVQLVAIPATGGGAPFFAKSYYGSAIANLSEGQATSVTIALTLGESKLVLPRYGDYYTTGTLRIADSLSSGITGTIAEPPAGGLAFDTHGRLFASTTEGYIKRYTDLTSAPEILGQYNYLPDGLAYEAGKNRLYSMYISEGYELWYTDLSASELTDTYISIPESYGISNDSSRIAVDDQGNLFLGLFNYSEDTYGIAKLSVAGTKGESVAASVTGFASYASLGIMGTNNIKVSDSIVKDGVLYFTVRDIYASNYPEYLYSRGKLIALSTTTMSKLWETGWAGEEAHFPSESNKNKQFYGPIQFVGVAPKKLYIADEGIYWSGTEGYAESVNRVIEVDLDTREISDVGLEGTVFIDDYQYLYVYGNYDGGA